MLCETLLLNMEKDPESHWASSRKVRGWETVNHAGFLRVISLGSVRTDRPGVSTKVSSCARVCFQLPVPSVCSGSGRGRITGGGLRS